MKKMIKHSNYFGFVLALCMMAISGCSCSAPKPMPDPLAGFHVVDLQHLDDNKTIAADYDDYLQKLPPNEKKYARVNGYYVDNAGQHAVRIEIDLNGTAWFHDLIYDKDNTRIKSIKHIGYHYAS
jgi:hypothetical protein